MPTTRPFPMVRGGCHCGQIRYQLEGAPLFCYACHCAECQKSSGSVFALNAIIEFDRVRCISTTTPKVLRFLANRHEQLSWSCPSCFDVLWERGDYSPWTYNVRIGTLDLPSLFEPDLHIFIEGKIDWLVLPEGARTLKGDMVRAKHWPKDSLARQEASKRRFEALKRRQDEKTVEHSESKKGKEQAEQVDDGENGQEEKTPTNGSPEPRGDDDEDEEDDEEYERRTDAIEKALQERLAQLTLKLSNQEKSQS